MTKWQWVERLLYESNNRYMLCGKGNVHNDPGAERKFSLGIPH